MLLCLTIYSTRKQTKFKLISFRFTNRPAIFLTSLPREVEQHVREFSEEKLIFSQWNVDDIEAQQRLLEEGNYAILDGVGERLIKTICQDACDATDVWKAVAFSALDVLITYDRKHHWLALLCHSGYLAHFIADIKAKENDLVNLLKPNPGKYKDKKLANLVLDTIRPLYVYESKMSLLTRIAQTQKGCAVLTEFGLLKQLSLCQFMDQRPEDLEMGKANYSCSFLTFSQILVNGFLL